MNLARLATWHPVATTLLSLGVALAGVLAYFQLPVASLPQVEYPVISVTASLPGASPETMAATVATPLERSLGAIAGVNEMTSYSSTGSTRVSLQFDLGRNINEAAVDVQAAINKARPMLPSGLPNLPRYRKVNPASAPILIIALTSDSLSRGNLYDVASTLLAQRLSQVSGVGQVNIWGGALPAVRVNVRPAQLMAYGLSMESVRSTLLAGNANRPKGFVEGDGQRWQVEANDQANTAEDYGQLIIRYQKGAAVRVSDVAEVSDSVQDLRVYGASDGKPAVLLVINQQPDANVIETVDAVKALLPRLQASIPDAVRMEVVQDRTPTIRASLSEIQKSMAISAGLVMLVVGLFLRRFRAALIPSLALPLSLLGAVAVMHLLGFSLNNLTLMALTVATGFVVDDAIVVVENVSRHLERGLPLLQAVQDGTREISFTIVSISLSLIAVFIPILFMGGILGRLFHEFAVVLSAAILVSMVVSLTTTPMLCAQWLGRTDERVSHQRRPSRMRRWYRQSLAWSLRHPVTMLVLLAATIALNVTLYRIIPKGLFPQQDTGRVFGAVRADQSVSFEAMKARLESFMGRIQQDPDVAHVVGFTGGRSNNVATVFVTLKPLSERQTKASGFVSRMRRVFAKESGARVFFVPAQDIRMGARMSDSQYEYTVKADDLDELRKWEPKIRLALSELPELTDISTDYEERGLSTRLDIDREALARYGLGMRDISQALDNAFSQKLAGVIYNPLNQYRVVLEASPEWLRSPEVLKDMQVVSAKGKVVPLSLVARVGLSNTALGVSHDGGVPSDTFSFNLAEGYSLAEATDAVQAAVKELKLPISVRGNFSGNAGAFKNSLSSQPLLIAAALLTLYIVLGVLYESLLHPLTILSTLPSAGVGALLALMAFGNEFSVVAFIGVMLLVGIVKKNAILMIDFALVRQRAGATPAQAIFKGAVLRVRPILMTTATAMLGALPLAVGSGDGAELRNPLGWSVVGGLLLSQWLTLYTTPVVFVLLERARARFVGARQARPTYLESLSHAQPQL
jgi:multidrug efflux pump